MKRHGPWRTLGLDPTEDRAAIRRAYADKLRALDVDQDIAGFARLRQARDHALQLAKGLADAQDTPQDPLDGDGVTGSPLDNRAVEADQGAPDGELLERPVEPAVEAAEPSAPQVLLAVLFPGGQTSEQELTIEEWHLVRPALDAILAQAETSSIDEHAAIDGWLAHHLASAWPRSAWLVEPAAEAFGWLDESGQLTERPAVQFLNLRLRGMRFVAKVEAPEHPLHKAWSELKRPGSRGAFAFLSVRKEDVRHLLSGIRERYPEVENHLDPQRVASWETSFEVTPVSAWFRSAPIFTIVGVVALVRMCVAAVDGHEPSTPPPAPIEIAWSADQVDQLVIELFGERLDNETLRNEAPALWAQIDRMSGWGGEIPDVVTEAGHELLVPLRAQSQLAAREAEFDELVAIKQVKLALLRLARDQRSADDCLDFETEARLSTNIEVPEAVRAEERALAAQLAAAHLLLPSEGQFPRTAAVSGALIAQVTDSTGLPEDTVRRALRGQGSDEVRCNLRIALLEAVLKRPGEASAELLRII